jgi:hypothetical protein
VQETLTMVDPKAAEISRTRRIVSNCLLAICVAIGALPGLILFAVAQALAGIEAGLAGNAGGSRLSGVLDLIVLSGGGALIGSLPGFALRYWVRKTKRVDRPDLPEP